MKICFSLFFALCLLQLSAAETLPGIVGTEQAGSRIVIMEPGVDWSRPEAVRWEWSAENNPEIRPEHRKWFRYPDEAKCVLGGTHLLMTAGGGAALIRISDRKVIYYVFVGGNPHSAELLPDGNLVTASSTGNYLRIYHIPADAEIDPEQVYSVKIPMEDAHGAVWDSEAKVLRASGLYGIVDFRYNFDKKSPMLERVAEHPVYPDGKKFYGHDLYPKRGTKTFFLSGIDVRIFDPADDSYRVISSAKNIKSVDALPGQEPIVNEPQKEWWTDSVSRLNQDGADEFRTLPEARFYKFRWFHPLDIAQEIEQPANTTN